ncbi:MAG: Methionyl-tRNA formyltransferase [Parcubacteria group bacterium GW2011_GWA2_51_10]|nr:MAG: Methionyl-tRNA formyltransferase [Parcubacteria group bacterium GW2011_GWA2_51_10]
MTNKKSGNKNNVRFVFLGTSHIAVYVLDALKAAGFLPALVVTPPPAPKGRGLSSAPTPVALWARESGISVEHDYKKIESEKWDIGVVVDFGEIIPESILSVPRRGFLNVHPSLLPRLRGPSPIRSAILNDEKTTGVSIILLDSEMDHGPIAAQKAVSPRDWPVRASELEEMIMKEGGTLLAQILPLWVAGEIEAREQNHDIATYTEKIKKEDGLLDLNADAYQNLLKIRAYEGWPGTYAFFEKNGISANRRIRVGIIDAHVEDGGLVIDTVKPEGKREMRYEEFLRSGAKSTQ